MKGRQMQLWVTLATSAITLASCSSERAARSSSPVIIPVRTVRLLESDSAPLGSFVTVAPAADGRAFVLDGSNGRVVVFGADGKLVRVIARKGGGPGELQMPTAVHLIAKDSLLAVTDAGTSALSLFEAATGRYLRSVRLPGDLGQEWSSVGDTIAVALIMQKPLLMTWRWDDSIVTSVGQTPPELLASQMLYLSGGRPEVMRFSDGYLAAIPGESWLRVLDAGGKTKRQFSIPMAGRRGVPLDLAAQLKQAPGSTDSLNLMPRASLITGLHRMSDATTVFIAMDIDQIHAMRPEKPGFSIFGNERLYITVLSKHLTRACVDAKLPIASAGTVYPVMLADTLFVVGRDSTGAGDMVELQSYRFDTTSCDWLPTKLLS